MSFRTIRCFLLGVACPLCVFGMQTSVHAGVTLFTDRAAFTSAAGSLTTIDFEGIVPTRGVSFYNSPSGLTLSGVNFYGATPAPLILPGPGYLAVVDPSYFPGYDWGSGATLQGSNTGRIDITFPDGGFVAIGSDIMGFQSFSQAPDFSITLSTGETFVASSSLFPNRAFVGFTSTTPITSLSFQTANANFYPELDNVSFRATQVNTAVPEPGTAAFGIIAGGALFSLMARRRKKNEA